MATAASAPISGSPRPGAWALMQSAQTGAGNQASWFAPTVTVPAALMRRGGSTYDSSPMAVIEPGFKSSSVSATSPARKKAGYSGPSHSSGVPPAAR